MEKSSFRRRWFGWLALTTFGTLLVVPATRHLFTTQARMETLTYSLDTDATVESAAAARLPDDYPVQLAHAAELPMIATDTLSVSSFIRDNCPYS